MRKTLTAEQVQKRDARRAQFKILWKQVSAMGESERICMSLKYGFRKAADNGEFSPCNSMLIALQNPQASVLAGFRGWMKLRRAVRKGEHGLMVWVPIGSKTKSVSSEGIESTDTNKQGFIPGTVFDISQTEAIEGTQRVEVLEMERAA